MSLPKRIDELTTADAGQVADDTYLIFLGNPATGELFKTTRDQLVPAVTTTIEKKNYTADGTEGTTLTFAELAGKTIFLIVREGNPIHEAGTPDEGEFSWDGTDIGLGLATRPGQRFLILYA
jgi:hypothetical protein